MLTILKDHLIKFDLSSELDLSNGSSKKFKKFPNVLNFKFSKGTMK